MRIEMKELGSDFHFYFAQVTGSFLLKGIFASNYYADGRHAIHAIVSSKTAKGEWKRIWIPEYFCYDVIDSIRLIGVTVLFYPDTPFSDDRLIIQSLPFEKYDVLFRMNYFGLRGWRDNSEIPVPVIEDHSHDLLSDWALRSNADWCVASLRKTLPIPEGGILWSPKQKQLPEAIKSSVENELVVYKRLSAMLLKTLYLSDQLPTKGLFRPLFVESEQALSDLSFSGMSDMILHLLESINIQEWYAKKRENWHYLFEHLTGKITLLHPEKGKQGTPFSLILSFNNGMDRNNFRKQLIQCNIYSAVLWDIPVTQNLKICNYGKCLLSVPCDARYNLKDMQDLSKLILNILKNVSCINVE